MADLDTVGGRVRHAMALRGMGLAALCQRAALTQADVAEPLDRVHVVPALAAALEVRPDWLRTGEGVMAADRCAVCGEYAEGPCAGCGQPVCVWCAGQGKAQPGRCAECGAAL